MKGTILFGEESGGGAAQWASDEAVLLLCRMSDLAVPMLMTFEDDALGFWCFERMMRRVKKNFRHDESGIK